MTPRGRHALRADLIAAWAIGTGIGLIVLMIAWIVGNRLFGLLLEPPRGPTVAFLAAIALGFATTAVAGKRLATSVRRDATYAHDLS
jgi:hypothetical protein